jgi:hypothetical protein
MSPEERELWFLAGKIGGLLPTSRLSTWFRFEYLLKKVIPVTLRQIMECNICKEEIPRGDARLNLELFNVPKTHPARTIHLHDRCFPIWAGEYFMGKIERFRGGGDKMGEQEADAVGTDAADAVEEAAEKVAEAAEAVDAAKAAEEAETGKD